MNFRTQKPRRWSFRPDPVILNPDNRPQLRKPPDMQIHRPFPNAAAARQTGFHPPQARQQRT